MAASGGQHDLDSGLMRGAQCRYIASGHLKIRISQSAVDIEGEEPDGLLLHGGSIITVDGNECGFWDRLVKSFLVRGIRDVALAVTSRAPHTVF